MTEIEFHTGVADVLGFACRLLRKAVRQGVRVQVMAAADRLSALDRSLWTFDERDFVPHVRMPGTAGTVAARTPIWLVEAALGQADAPDVLINVGAALSSWPPTLARVVEIVANDADEAAAGRERWRQYKALGLSIKHHAGV